MEACPAKTRGPLDLASSLLHHRSSSAEARNPRHLGPAFKYREFKGPRISYDLGPLLVLIGGCWQAGSDPCIVLLTCWSLWRSFHRSFIFLDYSLHFRSAGFPADFESRLLSILISGESALLLAGIAVNSPLMQPFIRIVHLSLSNLYCWQSLNSTHRPSNRVFRRTTVDFFFPSLPSTFQLGPLGTFCSTIYLLIPPRYLLSTPQSYPSYYTAAVSTVPLPSLSASLYS